MLRNLKAVQQEICSLITSDTRHVLLVNCGRGELGLTLRQKSQHLKVSGLLFQSKYLQAAEYNLNRVFTALTDLKGQKFDCIIFIDIHLFLKDPSLIRTLSIEHLLENGSVLLTCLNSQFVEYIKALSGSGNTQNIPYPYNLSLLRFLFQKFLLNIESIYGLVLPETDHVLQELPLKGFKQAHLSLSLPESGQVFTVFTAYLLLTLKTSKAYKPENFNHKYTALTSQQLEWFQSQFSASTIETTNFAVAYEDKQDSDFLNLMWDKLVHTISQNQHKHVLIIGAQEGQLGRYIKQFCLAVDGLFGIEEDPKLLKVLRTQPEFKQVFATVADFSEKFDHFFDCIICLEFQTRGLHPEKVLQQYQRLLRPEGSLLCSFQNFQNINQMRDLLIYGFSAYFNSQFEMPTPLYNLTYFQNLLKQTSFKWIEGLFLVESDFSENVSFPLQTHLDQFGHIEVNHLNQLLAFSSIYCFMVLKSCQDESYDPVQLSLVKYTFEHLQSVFYQSNLHRFWDKSGKTYFAGEQSGVNPGGGRYREAKFLVTRLKSLNPKKILEIGCGYGRNLKMLKEVIPGVQLTGLDISRGQLIEAKTYLDDETIDLVHYDGVSPLPFDSVSFDLVFTSGVLCILPQDKVKFLCEEMLRVAKYFVVNNEDNAIRDLRFYSHQYIQIYEDDFGYECRREPNPYIRGYFLHWIDKFKKRAESLSNQAV